MEAHIIDKNDDAILYEDGDGKPMTIQAAQQKINAILTGCNTASTIIEFIYRLCYCPLHETFVHKRQS